MNPYDFADSPKAVAAQARRDVADLDRHLAAEPPGPARDRMLEQRAGYAEMAPGCPPPPHAAVVTCRWYALCDHPAAGVVHHPILGDVPTCQRCADRHDLALVAGVVEVA